MPPQRASARRRIAKIFSLTFRALETGSSPAFPPMSCAPSGRARSCAICGPNGRDGRRFPASECEMTRCSRRKEPYNGPRVFCRGCNRHVSMECLRRQYSSTMAAVSSMAGFSLRDGRAWAAVCACIDRSWSRKFFPPSFKQCTPDPCSLFCE